MRIILKLIPHLPLASHLSFGSSLLTHSIILGNPYSAAECKNQIDNLSGNCQEKQKANKFNFYL